MKLFYTFLAIVCFLFNLHLTAQDRIFPSPNAQIETPIAINPTNPDNLIGAAITQDPQLTANQIGYYYSLNGGVDWDGSDNISGPGTGDPVVAFDPDGTAYLLYQNRGGISGIASLFLHKSTDGGINWSGPMTVVQFKNPAQKNIDRLWLIGLILFPIFISKPSKMNFEDHIVFKLLKEKRGSRYEGYSIKNLSTTDC